MAIPKNHIIFGTAIFYFIFFSFVSTEDSVQNKGVSNNLRENNRNIREKSVKNLNQTSNNEDDDLLARDLLIYIRDNKSKKDIDILGEGNQNGEPEKQTYPTIPRISEYLLKKYKKLKLKFYADIKTYFKLVRVYKKHKSLSNFKVVKEFYRNLKHYFKYYKIIYNYFTQRNYIREEPIVLPRFKLKPPNENLTEDEGLKNKLKEYRRLKKKYLQRLKKYYKFVEFYKNDSSEINYRNVKEYYDKLKRSYKKYYEFYDYLSKREQISDIHIPLPAFYVRPPDDGKNQMITETNQKLMINFGKLKQMYGKVFKRYYVLSESYKKATNRITIQQLKDVYAALLKTYENYKFLYEKLTKGNYINEDLIPFPSSVIETPEQIIQRNEVVIIKYKNLKENYKKYLQYYYNLIKMYENDRTSINFKNVMDMYTSLRRSFGKYKTLHNYLFQKNIIKEKLIGFPPFNIKPPPFGSNRKQNQDKQNIEFKKIRKLYITFLKQYETDVAFYKRNKTVKNFEKLKNLYEKLQIIFNNYKTIHNILFATNIIQEKLIPLPKFIINDFRPENERHLRDLTTENQLNEFNKLKSLYQSLLKKFIDIKNPGSQNTKIMKEYYANLISVYKKYKIIYDALSKGDYINEQLIPLPPFPNQQSLGLDELRRGEKENQLNKFRVIKEVYVTTLKKYLTTVAMYERNPSDLIFENLKDIYNNLRRSYIDYKNNYESLRKGDYINENLIPIPEFNLSPPGKNLNELNSQIKGNTIEDYLKLKKLYIQLLKQFVNNKEKYKTEKNFKELEDSYIILKRVFIKYKVFYENLTGKNDIQETFIPLPRFDVERLKPRREKNVELPREIKVFKKLKDVYVVIYKKFLKLTTIYQRNPSPINYKNLKDLFENLRRSFGDYKNMYDNLTKKNYIKQKFIPLPSFNISPPNINQNQVATSLQSLPQTGNLIENFKKLKNLYSVLLKKFIYINKNFPASEKLNKTFVVLKGVFKKYKTAHGSLSKNNYINEKLIPLPSFEIKPKNNPTIVDEQKTNNQLNEYKKQKSIYLLHLKKYNIFIDVYKKHPTALNLKNLQIIYENLRRSFGNYKNMYNNLSQTNYIREQLILLPKFVIIPERHEKLPRNSSVTKKAVDDFNTQKNTYLILLKKLNHINTNNPTPEDVQILKNDYPILLELYKKYKTVYDILSKENYITEELIPLPRFDVKLKQIEETENLALDNFKKVKRTYVLVLKKYNILIPEYRENPNPIKFKNLQNMYNELKRLFKNYKNFHEILSNSNNIKEKIIPLPAFKISIVDSTKTPRQNNQINEFLRLKKEYYVALKKYNVSINTFKKNPSALNYKLVKVIYRNLKRSHDFYSRIYDTLVKDKIINEKLIPLPEFSISKENKFELLLIFFNKIKKKYETDLEIMNNLIQLQKKASSTLYKDEKLVDLISKLKTTYEYYEKLYSLLSKNKYIHENLMPLPQFNIKNHSDRNLQSTVDLHYYPSKPSSLSTGENQIIILKRKYYFTIKGWYEKALDYFYLLLRAYEKQPSLSGYHNLQYFFTKLQRLHKYYETIYNELSTNKYVQDKLIILPQLTIKLPENEIRLTTLPEPKIKKLVLEVKDEYANKNLDIYNKLKHIYIRYLEGYIFLIGAYKEGTVGINYNYLRSYYNEMLRLYNYYKTFYFYLYKNKPINETLIQNPRFAIEISRNVTYLPFITEDKSKNDYKGEYNIILKKIKDYSDVKANIIKGIQFYNLLVNNYKIERNKKNYETMKKFYDNFRRAHENYLVIFNDLYKKNIIMENPIQLPRLVSDATDSKRVELGYSLTSGDSKIGKDLLQKKAQYYKAIKKQYKKYLLIYNNLVLDYKKSPSQTKYNYLKKLHENLRRSFNNYKNLYDNLTRLNFINDTFLPLPNFNIELQDNTAILNEFTRKSDLNIKYQLENFYRLRKFYLDNYRHYYKLLDAYQNERNQKTYFNVKIFYDKLKNSYMDYKKLHDFLFSNKFIKEKQLLFPPFEIKLPERMEGYSSQQIQYVPSEQGIDNLLTGFHGLSGLQNLTRKNKNSLVANLHDQFKVSCQREVNIQKTLMEEFKKNPNARNFERFRRSFPNTDSSCKKYKIVNEYLIRRQYIIIPSHATELSEYTDERNQKNNIRSISSFISLKKELNNYYNQINQFQVYLKKSYISGKKSNNDYDEVTIKNAEKAYQELMRKYKEYVQDDNNIFVQKIIKQEHIPFLDLKFYLNLFENLRNRGHVKLLLYLNKLYLLNIQHENASLEYLNSLNNYKASKSMDDYNITWLKYRELFDIRKKYVVLYNYLISAGVLNKERLKLITPFSPRDMKITLDKYNETARITNLKPTARKLKRKSSEMKFDVKKLKEYINIYSIKQDEYKKKLIIYQLILDKYKQTNKYQLYINLLNFLKQLIDEKNYNNKIFSYLKKYVPSLQPFILPELPAIPWLQSCFKNTRFDKSGKNLNYKEIYTKKIINYLLRAINYKYILQKFILGKDINNFSLLYRIFKEREEILESYIQIINTMNMLIKENLLFKSAICESLPPLIKFENSEMINLIKLPNITENGTNLEKLELYKQILLKYYTALANYYNINNNFNNHNECNKTDINLIEKKVNDYQYHYKLYKILILHKIVLNKLAEKLFPENKQMEQRFLERIPKLPVFNIYEHFESCLPPPVSSNYMTESKMIYLKNYYRIIKMLYLMHTSTYNKILLLRFMTERGSKKVDTVLTSIYEKLKKLYFIHKILYNQMKYYNLNVSDDLFKPPRFYQRAKIPKSQKLNWDSYPIKSIVNDYEQKLRPYINQNPISRIVQYYKLLGNLLNYYLNIYKLNARIYLLYPTIATEENLNHVEFVVTKTFDKYFNKYFKIYNYLLKKRIINDTIIIPFVNGIIRSKLISKKNNKQSISLPPYYLILPIDIPGPVTLKPTTTESTLLQYYKLIKSKYLDFVQLYRTQSTIHNLKQSKSTFNELKSICHDLTETYLVYNKLFIKYYKIGKIKEGPLKLECKIPQTDPKYSPEILPQLSDNPNAKELSETEKYYQLIKRLYTTKIKLLQADINLYSLLRTPESKDHSKRALESAYEVYNRYITIYQYLIKHNVITEEKLFSPENFIKNLPFLRTVNSPPLPFISMPEGRNESYSFNTQRSESDKLNTQRPESDSFNTQRPESDSFNTQRPESDSFNTQRPITSTTSSPVGIITPAASKKYEGFSTANLKSSNKSTHPFIFGSFPLGSKLPLQLLTTEPTLKYPVNSVYKRKFSTFLPLPTFLPSSKLTDRRPTLTSSYKSDSTPLSSKQPNNYSTSILSSKSTLSDNSSNRHSSGPNNLSTKASSVTSTVPLNSTIWRSITSPSPYWNYKYVPSSGLITKSPASVWTSKSKAFPYNSTPHSPRRFTQRNDETYSIPRFSSSSLPSFQQFTGSPFLSSYAKITPIKFTDQSTRTNSLNSLISNIRFAPTPTVSNLELNSSISSWENSTHYNSSLRNKDLLVSFLQSEKEFNEALAKYYEDYSQYNKNKLSPGNLIKASKKLFEAHANYYSNYLSCLKNEQIEITEEIQKRFLMVPHILVDLIQKGKPISIPDLDTDFLSSSEKSKLSYNQFEIFKKALYYYIKFSYETLTNDPSLKNILKTVSFFYNVVDTLARFMTNYKLENKFSIELDVILNSNNLLTLPISVQNYLLNSESLRNSNDIHNGVLDNSTLKRQYDVAKINYYSELINYFKNLKKFTFDNSEKILNDSLVSYTNVIYAQHIYFFTYIRAALAGVPIKSIFPRYPVFIKNSKPDLTKNSDKILKIYYEVLIEYYKELIKYYKQENPNGVYLLLKKYKKLLNIRRRITKKLRKMSWPTEQIFAALRNFPVFGEKLPKQGEISNDNDQYDGDYVDENVDYEKQYNIDLYKYYVTLNEFIVNSTSENKKDLLIKTENLLDNYEMLYKDLNYHVNKNYTNPFALSITVPIVYDERKLSIPFYINYLRKQLSLVDNRLQLQEDDLAQIEKAAAFHTIKQRFFNSSQSSENTTPLKLNQINNSNRGTIDDLTERKLTNNTKISQEDTDDSINDRSLLLQDADEPNNEEGVTADQYFENDRNYTEDVTENNYD